MLVGPGDDMALIDAGGRGLLAAVDQVVCGCHFHPATPLRLVGRKAVSRSVSDVAAMAGVPLACLAATVLPAELAESEALELFEAIRRTALEYRCPLVGGDIAIHRAKGGPLACTVAVLAEPGARGPVTRSGARRGDGVFVTGVLGGSLEPGGMGRHLTFEPRVAEAAELATILGESLHAMIDLSDGLGRDASHLAQRSGVRIEIDASLVPCREGLDWRRALGDGEDYELCFSAAGAVPEAVGDLAVTRVGRVLERGGPGEPLVLVREGATAHDAASLGWEHGA